jgi:hypothetical protein
MPTKLTRYTLTFTKAQLESLKLRFPNAVNDKQAIYLALGFDLPQPGGKREGAGRPKRSRKALR